MLSLYFNNRRIPDWVQVDDITEEILAALEATAYKTTFGVKKININFSFEKNMLISLSQKSELISWLKGNNFKPSILILPTRPDRYYLAKVTNLSEINGSISLGQGSIEFTVFEGNEIDFHKNKIILNNNLSKEIYYDGDITVYPIIIFKISSACTKIKLITPNGFIEINNSFNAGDLIEFNQDTYNLKVNNNTNMQILHLLSKRTELTEGENIFKLETGNCTVEIIWQNKYH